MIGGRVGPRPESDRASFGVVQGTLLGLVGLLLAFGMSMAVGRYDVRRSMVVTEANAIGTTYLRAQLLAEPERGDTLELLAEYGDAATALATAERRDTPPFVAAAAQIAQLQRDLWGTAGDAVAADPTGSAPRLYIEALNTMIDAHTSAP